MPIDPDFSRNRPAAGEHNGHKVFGPVEAPQKLGIHGSVVAVDFDLCNGDSKCLDICPVSVFEMMDTPGNPVSPKKADPIRENDCIFCMACETQCEYTAIKVTQA
ncbi:MAG TPA: ferredoxin family protein [Conexivisphaerales archaeon]|nr:ferredoxin family protein [Conexivisphaerales archaeon]